MDMSFKREEHSTMFGQRLAQSYNSIQIGPDLLFQQKQGHPVCRTFNATKCISKNLPPMKYAKSQASLSHLQFYDKDSCRSQVIISGGKLRQLVSKCVEMYTFATERWTKISNYQSNFIWTELPQLNQARYAHASCAISASLASEKSIYIFCGR